MNIKILFISLIVLLMAVSAVSASENETLIAEEGDYHSFSELDNLINNDSVNEITLKNDYKYDNYNVTIVRNSSGTINGNNHVIDGINNSKGFSISCGKNNLTIANLTFQNCNEVSLTIGSPVIFKNVKFINCSGESQMNFLLCSANATFNNCVFQMKGEDYEIISTSGNFLLINNTLFDGNKSAHSAIYADHSVCVYVENTTFANLTGPLGNAINTKGSILTVKKSKFINLHGQLSAGAILGKYFVVRNEDSEPIPSAPFIIEDCEFINVTSANDAGALYFDLDSCAEGLTQYLNVFNCSFTDCASRFGGAIAILGGCLNITDSTFKNNSAAFSAGAIYSSWSIVNISNSNFTNNNAKVNGGAFYIDHGKLIISNSNIINNKANAVYAEDSELDFKDSTFDNGGVSVYGNFISKYDIKNVQWNRDTFSLDNKEYLYYVENEGIPLVLIDNSIDVEKLPTRFDGRDFNWITPLKNQSLENDDCWAFATVASLEAALMKSTGKFYDLSPNYIQKLQLKYYRVGDLRISLTGFAYSGLGNALSWYGPLQIDGPYDYRAMITDTDLSIPRVHLQDAMFVYCDEDNITEMIKRAVLRSGAVTVQIIDSKSSDAPSPTDDNIDIMEHGTHFISIIGWDDNHKNSEGELDPSYIIKDALGMFSYMSYDDERTWGIDYFAIVPQCVAVSYIFENNINYHMNYQTDFTSLAGFDGNYTYYSNEFVSVKNDLIGAVGTYFNESGINYSFDVYVNGAKVHTQTGVSEFAGFRTIVLNKYIPVKTGDKFKVVFKSNGVPYQAFSRQHYISGMSLVSADGKSWSDMAAVNKTVCLKVYTLEDDTKIISNNNIVVDYAGGKYFTAKVVTGDGRAVGAGAIVKFTINGKTYTVKTDNNGVAKLKITQLPKKYTLTTTYNGKTYKNTVTVKQVLTTKKVTIKKTYKKFTLQAKLKVNGKLVKGKIIKFKFKGKTYKAKTNKKGIAKVTIKKKVIKKLKKGKKYTVKVTYLKDTIKTTVKVKK